MKCSVSVYLDALKLVSKSLVRIVRSYFRLKELGLIVRFR